MGRPQPGADVTAKAPIGDPCAGWAARLTPGANLHATSVALGGRGVLIAGPAGSGKSSLALGLIDRDGRLIADDLTVVTAGGLTRPAGRPPALHVRGIGLLNVPATAHAPLHLIVDLSLPSESLPPRRRVAFAGAEIDILPAAAISTLSWAIPHILRDGRAI